MNNDVLRSSLPELVIVLRMVLAIVLGGIVGFEREIRSRGAGLRTHILVALAATTFTLITIEIYREAADARADPVRIVDAVTAGVAFIAAGAIIKSAGDVRGLTTGVAVWLAGAIGVACGIGYYLVAILAAVFGVAVLRGIGWIEAKTLGKKIED